MWIFWLIAAGVFFIGEIITTGFLILWLGVGALLAMVVSFFTESLVIQTAVFAITSALFLFFTKPFIQKFVSKKSVPTNFYSIIGKKGIVIEPINATEGTGKIKVSGEVWSAECDEDMDIPKDTEIEILRIDGVRAFVKPIKKAAKL